MAEQNEENLSPTEKIEKFQLFEVWKEYEKIAMHFNVLLIQLRMRALAGVAAIGTIVGIFTKFQGTHIQGSWEIATGVLGALCLFWIAIFKLDYYYYNRLLEGSVQAILNLEKRSKEGQFVTELELSTLVVKSVMGTLERETKKNESKGDQEQKGSGRKTSCAIARGWRPRIRGVFFFYSIVFGTLISAFFYSLCKSL